MKKISVIIPCRNEEKYIADCLDSVINNDYPKDYMTVILIDGMSTDTTQSIIQSYVKKYNYIHYILNEKRTVPCALNLGIKKSKGDYIIILGAHSEIPKNYFSKLMNWNIKLDADNVGAICITEVRNKNPKTNSIKCVLSNKFGVGNSFFRIGVDQVKEVDNISFGCYKKNVYFKIGFYDERLERNQDIELNKRLKKNGGKIYLIPDLFFTYYARETFSGIAMNNFQTGMWNILTVYLTKRINSLSLRHFIPLLFLLSLLIPLILMIFNPLFGYIALNNLIIYFITLITVSLRIQNSITSLFFIIWAFIVLHFSYGFGSLIGLFRIDNVFKSNKNEH